MENNFLKKKYNLHNTPEVESAAKRTQVRTGEKVPQNPEAQIQNYLDRFKEIVDRKDPDERERGIEALKKVLYDKFVTKYEEIPASYWKSQENILRERGQLGDWQGASDEQREKSKKETAEGLLDDQRSSLEEWIDYFATSDSSYIPDEIKYWVFRSITSLQEYDKDKKEFRKRSNGEVKMFPDLNQEALGYVIDSLLKKINGESLEFGYDISEEEQGKFKQYLDQENFSKLYAWAVEWVSPIPEHLMKVTDGQWVKYDQGSDHMSLVKSIQRKGTGWCTAGQNTAHKQLSLGDFYVYYSLDDEQKPTTPRIAIRMEGNKIAEVRGVAFKQNLDPYMSEILQEKLQEFPDKDKYLKKDSDMKRLTEIDNKTKKGEQLTKEDLSFLYEIDSKIEGFGYKRDPRIEEIISSRDTKSDLSKVTGYSPEEISLTKEEALSGEKKFHYGDLDLSDLTFARGLKLPEHIGGGLNLGHLISAEGLKLPEHIGGGLNLEGLTFARGLKLPEHIGGNLDLSRLTSAEGLKLPEHIGGNIYLSSLTSAEGLKLPEHIGGNIYLSSLTSAEGLKLPKHIGGNIYLSSLTSAEGLKLPEHIGGDLYLWSLTSEEKIYLANKFPNLADKII